MRASVVVARVFRRGLPLLLDFRPREAEEVEAKDGSFVRRLAASEAQVDRSWGRQTRASCKRSQNRARPACRATHFLKSNLSFQSGTARTNHARPRSMRGCPKNKNPSMKLAARCQIHAGTTAEARKRGAKMAPAILKRAMLGGNGRGGDRAL